MRTRVAAIRAGQPLGSWRSSALNHKRHLFRFRRFSEAPRKHSRLRCTYFASRLPRSSGGHRMSIWGSELRRKARSLRCRRCSRPRPIGFHPGLHSNADARHGSVVSATIGWAFKSHDQQIGNDPRPQRDRLTADITRSLAMFPSVVRRRSKPVPRRRMAYRELRRSGRRSASRCLEANCVPQRAGNGSARGPAVETRDTGKLSNRREERI